MEKQRESFGSRTAVILAMAGSAIGLGNIWRFPYMTGEYGGAAFVLIYVLCSVFLSLPIFLAEAVIGRRTRKNAIGAMKTLAPGSGWNLLGYLSVITPMIIVSYYSVVGGWSLEYLLKACRLEYLHGDPQLIPGTFSSFISSPWAPLACFTAVLAFCCLIVAGGVRRGIEKFSKMSMPVLFVLVVLIMVYSLTLPGAGAGVNYLLKPDFSKITAKTCAFALGQSFYSLSLGMGIIITYSSYVKKEENLLVSAGGTALADLLFAMLAAMAIMPAVFAVGLSPSSGPGLIFETLPYIFSGMGEQLPVLSSVAAILFFLTVLVAGVTSIISLLEVGVAYLVEERKMRRPWACVAVFCFAWVLGGLSSLSFGPLSGLQLAGNGIFDMLDKFSSNFLLTLGAFLAVLFVGWKMPQEDFRDEFTNHGEKKANVACFAAVRFLIRYVCPIAIAIIFITNFL